MPDSRMTETDIGRETTVLFIRSQLSRALFRLRLVILASFALGFWVLAISGATWLVSWGYGWLAGLLALAWLILASPALLVQVALILDVAFYFLTQRSYFFAVLRESRRPADEVRRKGWVYWIVQVGAYTSPLGALSVWSYGVLIRLPERLHAATIEAQPQPQPRVVDRMQGEYWAALSHNGTEEMAHV